MKTAVLLNDTSYENHHGCSIVIKNIERNLLQRDIELIATNPIGKDWKKNHNFLKALAICDIVLVNAEGTIHHCSPYGLTLLEIVNATKKPCILMNMTYQSNSDVYADLIRKFTKVYVRESMSQKELASAGIDATVIPDMTFDSSYEIVDQRNSDIYITDSHDIKFSEILYNFTQRSPIKFLPILAPYKKFSTKKGLIKKIKYFFFMHMGKMIPNILSLKYSYLRYMHVCQEHTFIEYIGHSSLLITARFHALCMAIQTLTPFIVLKSNTHKIEGLLQDMQFSQERLIELSTLEKFVNSTEPNTGTFVFTPEEVEKIRSYTKDAKKHIEQMFNEIARLSENKHKEFLKIGILITDLAGGGAERVVLTLADSFKMEGIETKIIILEDIIKHDIKDTIVLSLSDPRRDSKIISYLGFDNIYTKIIKFKKRLAKKMKKSYVKKKAKKLQLLQKKENFDFFISHLPLADEVIKLTDLKRVFVIHTDYRAELELLQQKQPFRAIRREKKYKSIYRGEKLVAISKGVAEGIKSFIDCAEIKIISNPFILKDIERKSQEDQIPYSFDYILHPARFYPIKRHDILFQSIRYMKNNLKIILLTNRTEALDKLIQKYQVEDRIIVSGFHQNPYPYFLNAKLTVLSSEREGLPTVLIESLILHTPIVSTNCPSGPEEIMRGDLSDYLAKINDPKDLAQKIDLALKDYPEIGSQYYDMFDSQKIVQEYLNYMAK